MRTIEELQAMLEIDKNNMEVELLHQPQLFEEVSDSYAQSAARRDTAKHIADKTAAEIGINYKQTSIDKVTEAGIDRYVAAHPDYINQYKFYLQYKAETERWEALKSAFAQRSSMLRDLIQLLGIGYWGSGIKPEDKLSSTYGEKYREYHSKRE